MVSQLDPSWTEPEKEILQIITFVEKSTEYISKNGWMKIKRLKSLAEVIPKQTNLYNVVELSALSIGVNTGKVIIGCVVNLIATKGYLPM